MDYPHYHSAVSTIEATIQSEVQPKKQSSCLHALKPAAFHYHDGERFAGRVNRCFLLRTVDYYELFTWPYPTVLIMRLLELKSNGHVSLTKDLINNIPPYAILSHTWGNDIDEVTFKDLTEGSPKAKTGYNKILFCAARARTNGLQYIWIDTCCIDKSNNAELSEAIISMFRWYRDAAKCYAYLTDVSTTTQNWTPDFRKARWFTRGWTLQELIAPSSVEFFSVEGELLGSKRLLEQQVHEITGIAVKALRGHALSEFSVSERLSWTEFRQTTREEDKAYSLLGIFNVNMPPLYGEGTESAFRRLHEEISKGSSSAHDGKYLVDTDISRTNGGRHRRST
jgi:hypothetical protein